MLDPIRPAAGRRRSWRGENDYRLRCDPSQTAGRAGTISRASRRASGPSIRQAETRPQELWPPTNKLAVTRTFRTEWLSAPYKRCMWRDLKGGRPHISKPSLSTKPIEVWPRLIGKVESDEHIWHLVYYVRTLQGSDHSESRADTH